MEKKSVGLQILNQLSMQNIEQISAWTWGDLSEKLVCPTKIIDIGIQGNLLHNKVQAEMICTNKYRRTNKEFPKKQPFKTFAIEYTSSRIKISLDHRILYFISMTS